MKISSKALLAAAVLGGVLPALGLQPPAPGASPADPPVTARTPAPTTEEADEPDAPSNPEPGVSKQDHVNVRGQATLKSEVVARLEKGQPVTILEEIVLRKPAPDEPSRWYRIALPTNVAVWVHSLFIDAETMAVKPRRLNLRGGPGENYSVLGRIERGATVKKLDAKGLWLKIEPPTNSYGFVAAHLVERTPAAAIVATSPATPVTNEVAAVPPPPTTTAVPETTPPTVAATPAVPPATTVIPAPAETTPPVATPAPIPTPRPAESVPPPAIERVRKVVSREGILRGSVSIQAPTYFALRSLDTGKTINYVHSPSEDLKLEEYKGKRVILTGEEVLDERWQNTPVLIVESLQTVP